MLFPSDCRLCRGPLTNISSLPVCAACLEKISPIEGPLCSVCGEKLPLRYFESESGPICTLCRRVAPPFRQAMAYGAYEGALRDLLHVFKYQQVRSAGPFLAGLLQQRLGASGLPAELVVVPVPLFKSKRRARGFNQSEEIARALVRGCKGRGRIQLDTSSLARIRETASQTGLTRHQRRENVRGAFAVTRPERIRARDILVLDDVMTTGTTAGECARVLLRAGAKQVFVATLARAIREGQSAMAVGAGANPGGTQGHA